MAKRGARVEQNDGIDLPRAAVGAGVCRRWRRSVAQAAEVPGYFAGVYRQCDLALLGGLCRLARRPCTHADP